MSRRSVLEALLGLGLVAAGCRPRAVDDAGPPSPALPAETGSGHASPSAYSDGVDALCDVLLPAEHDGSGKLLSVGAREAGVARVISRFSDLGAAFRETLNRALDAAALVQKPLTKFQDLPRALQEAAVDQAFDDPAQKTALLVVRAACMTAYLGAVENDAGLQDVGFPPFESFADGLAVRGYPRTKSGRLVDATTESLAQLDADGDLDDYTYNREPEPTPGDDLSNVLDANGDLL
jgi:hypothetical protein